MTKEYAKLENHIIKLFEEEKTFQLDGDVYRILTVGKPRPTGGGECKTDVYVLGQNRDNKKKELRISVKRAATNEFQGNKFTPQAAQDLLGVDWSNILSKATKKISHKFENKHIMFADKFGRTLPNSITMGWKLEIASKQRDLSAPLPLSDIEIKDLVYKGTKQPVAQKDAKIDGVEYPDSGIAEYIIYTEVEDIKSVEEIVENITLIDEKTFDPTFLIFTANNWRTDDDNVDGKRYLAVIVEWKLEDGKLVPDYNYDQPLLITGYSNKFHMPKLFKKLNVQHPSDLVIGSHIDEKYIFSKTTI